MQRNLNANFSWEIMTSSAVLDHQDGICMNSVVLRSRGTVS